MIRFKTDCKYLAKLNDYLSAHLIFIYVRTHLDCRPAFSSRRHSKHWINSRRLQQKFKYFSFANENYEDPQSLKCVYTIKQVPAILCTSFNTVNIHSKVEKDLVQLGSIFYCLPNRLMNWIGMHQSANDLYNPNESHPKEHFEVHHGPTYVIKYRITYHQGRARSIIYIKRNINTNRLIKHILFWFITFVDFDPFLF